MTAEELMARFERACLLSPESPTATLLVNVFDEFRAEVDKQAYGVKATREALKADNDARYRYSIAHFKVTAEGQRYYTDILRLTLAELKDLAARNQLDYNKLYSVAMGDREQYRGFIQGPLLPFTYGHTYKATDDDVREPQVEKHGVLGLFAGGLRNRTNDDE